MRYQAWVGIAGLLFVALAPALADAPAWVVYTSTDKRMTVRFPAKPTEKDHAGATQGEKLRVATWIDGDKALVASGGPYPASTLVEVRLAWTTRPRACCRSSARTRSRGRR